MDQMKKPLKTYSNPSKTKPRAPSTVGPVPDPYKKVNEREPLSTKKAVELLLSGNLKSRVCRYCLNIAFPLSELNQNMHIAGRGALYEVAIRDMVASFHPFEVVDDPNFPNKICNKCLNQAIRSYLFAQQCEQAERAIRNCFDDMYEKLEKLDSLDRTKKRGRQKLNPNYNILYTDHQKVIDYAEPIRNLINSGSVSFTKEPKITDLECKKCWQVLPNVESLANHDKMHPKNMWLHCRLCGKSFPKRYQMNRHLRYNHKPKNLAIQDTESHFECKDCGYTSSDYLQHLQHIEKHKFRTVLEHLVERNMDKLCTVCLEKGGKMVGMDKIVCLHGGYPELTGDHTLYNILGSTVPEHKSYKYQELFVSCKANVISISKKPNIDDSKEFNQIFKNLVMSKPVVISTENVDYEDVYLFTFSRPHMLNEAEFLGAIADKKANVEKVYEKKGDKTEIEEINVLVDVIDQNEDLSYENHNSLFESYGPAENNQESNINEMLDFYDIDNSKSDFGQQSPDLLRKTYTFTFSNPGYVGNNEDPQTDSMINESERKETKLCKKCWIFNETKCAECIDTSISETKEESRQCQFCWLFQKVGRCDFCKKENIGKEDVPAITEITFKEVINAGIDTKKVNKVIKRKKFQEETETKPKKTKWQCNVCLVTNNSDRETCICCEAKKLCEYPIKIIFNSKNSYFDPVEIFEKENSEANDLDSHKAGENLTESTLEKIDIDKMDETTPSCQENTDKTIPSHCELMDTEENQSYQPPNLPNTFPNPFAIPNVSSNQLQFNIGIVTKGNNIRKFKKPLRKIVAAFHK